MPPGDLAAAEPIVRLMLGLADVIGRGIEVAARSAWHDGVTFTRFGTPCIAFGPGELGQAHAVDEHVAIDDLLACAQGLAVAALRFAGRSR